MGRRGFIRRTGAGVAGALGVYALVLAALTPGVEVKDLDLNDGGVWVTNAKRGLVAHVNVPARLMDSAVHADSASFDVYQNGEDLQVADIDEGTLAPLNAATSTVSEPVQFGGLTVAVNGGTIALTDAESGRVWTQPASQMTPIDTASAEPRVSGLAGAVTAVGRDGRVHAASVDAAKVVSAGTDLTEQPVERPLNAVAKGDHLQIAAVGALAVVWDEEASSLHLPDGRTVRVEGEGVRLQDSGPEASDVVLASSKELIYVPLDPEQQVTRVKAKAEGGITVAPTRVGQCVYGAWSSSGSFIRDCPGEHDDRSMTVDTLAQADKPVFRVNRDVIVLNDTVKDGLWLPDSDMVLVDNWDQIQSTAEVKEEEEDSVEDKTEIVPPDRQNENTPPIAVDDEFGVRAGRTTILPVLLNDSDADGDFLTAAPTSQPGLGAVTPAREGAALQITTPQGASGSESFEYEVSDGRGGIAKARVTLTVHGDEVNEGPRQLHVPQVDVGPGRSAVVNGLMNWIDPDGDPFFLADAIAPTGLTTRHDTSGSVEIKDIGHPVGSDTIALKVSDGRDEGEGEINVAVIDAENRTPVANADHLVVRQGDSAAIAPLENDSDPNGDSLRIVDIGQVPAGISASLDGTNATVTVDGRTPGTYYLSYTVTDGPLTAVGVIRIDVAPGDSTLPPTAEDDLGVLPVGGQVLVDLLANDSDPTGGVLTVQQVDLPAGSPLVVALVDHRLARITATNGLDGPATFTYTVSNGMASSSSTVTVIPRSPSTQAAPPELTDDVLVVRAGDIGAVPVLANDRSPANLRLTVSAELQHEIPADLATVFFSDNVIRVRGGSRAGSGRIVYTATDSMGNVASAVVNLTVVAPDPDANTAPKPKDVTARTVAGAKTLIRVPLDGIDAEGDSTTLVGIASAPKMGTVQQVGFGFEYVANPDAKGTDSFTYLVEDALGKQAVGRIRVGIAPRPSINHPPIAVADQTRVRPGKKVAVAVLANDIDPDGDALSLVGDSVVSSTSDLDLSVRSGRIVMSAPEREGTYVVSYRVEDGNGGEGEGTCTFIVTANAPFTPPIARDDEVTFEQVRQVGSNPVAVDVTKNDEDPDGDIDDATLSSSDSGVQVSGRQLLIDVEPTPRRIIYTLTDADGASASAVVYVPGNTVQRPTVDPTTVPIRAKAGETTRIRINDHLVVREGRQATITNETRAIAGEGWDGSTLIEDPQTISFTATPDFSGSTSITFDVTDGTDVNDSSGLVATVSLPVEVEGAQNHPPRFSPTPVEVAAGEGEVAVDLTQWVRDPDGDDPATMTYRISSSIPNGVSAGISGSTLTVSAGLDAPKGDVGAINVEVTDPGGEAATSTVPIRVSASNRPFIQVTPAELTLKAGESTSIDVAQHATNPFPERGPVELVGTPAATNGASVTASGTSLQIQAPTGFNGAFTVTYRLGDATKEASREVQGTITVTVKDKPTPPSKVAAASNSAGSALVSWTAGAANGSPIAGFTVTDHTQGDSKECGMVTTCLVEGRTNGVEHVFSVTATNEVGVSDPSAQARVLIDVEPEAPATPAISGLGDGVATVTWTAPRSEGSAITGYEVTLSPGLTVNVGPGQTTHTFTGLSNGTHYTATVRAKNSKGWSQPSLPSLEAIPYGAPAKVLMFVGGTVWEGNAGTVNLAWVVPDTNGRAIEYFDVEAGPWKTRLPGTTTSVAIPVHSAGPATDGLIDVRITAVNDAADPVHHSSTSVERVKVRISPMEPSISSVAPTGRDGELSLSWSPSPAGGGWSPPELRYQWKTASGNWQELPVQSPVVLSGNGLANGVGTSIVIRAYGSDGAGGSPDFSQEVTSAQVAPYGPPKLGDVSCVPGNAPGKLECAWSGGDTGGREALLRISDIFKKTNVGGAREEPFAPSGSRTLTAHPGEEVEFCVSVHQRNGASTRDHCAIERAALN